MRLSKTLKKNFNGSVHESSFIINNILILSAIH